jgi:hypothetical protein
MEKYKHMGFSAGAERHFDPDASGSYPIAMLFRLAGDEVIEMTETRWTHLKFATSADAADFAARQCRNAIDVLFSRIAHVAAIIRAAA